MRGFRNNRGFLLRLRRCGKRFANDVLAGVVEKDGTLRVSECCGTGCVQPDEVVVNSVSAGNSAEDLHAVAVVARDQVTTARASAAKRRPGRVAYGVIRGLLNK